MAGGFLIIGILVLATIFFKFFDIYSQSVSQNWAESSAEAQARNYSEYMTKMTWISFVGLALKTIQEHVFDKRRKVIGRDIHKETLKRLLLAPINNFFDVTPIGKIMTIFSEDLQVFYGRILDAPMRMMQFISNIIVVFSLMFAIGDWFLVPCLALMVLLMHWVSKPYLQADNQLWMVHHSIWVPFRSRVHEAIRGTSVIRAFGQEEKVVKDQSAHLDKTTV